MSLPVLVDGAVLACVAVTPAAVAAGNVTVDGTATHVFSSTLPALLPSDIENAAGADDSVAYVTPIYVIAGSGHFESFVILTGSTSNFLDGSDNMHLNTASGTCTFKVDTAATWTGPAPPPVTDPVSSYPATWIVNNHGQATVYLKASP